jgi:O-antigen/teichoic acid export membrane protein
VTTPGDVEAVGNRAITESRTQSEMTEQGGLSLFPMIRSGSGMIVGKAAAMALGFLFWVFAARLYPEDTVGLAAAAISAGMLCIQFALLGTESAFITLYPHYSTHPGRLLATTGALVTALGAFAGVAFLLLAAWFAEELNAVGHDPLFAALFVYLVAIGALGVVVDKVSMARRKGEELAARNTVNGSLTLVPLGIAFWIGWQTDAAGLFGFWVFGATTAMLLGVWQLGRPPSVYRPRLVFDTRVARQVTRVGLPNYLLSLAERAPALILPVLVTEMISVEANAYWYPVWMMAWGSYVIPSSLGIALFAEGAHRPDMLKPAVDRAVKASLVLGAAAIVAGVTVGPLLLKVMGTSYTDAGTTPLRIMLLAAIPMAFTSAYFAVCRATDRLGEGTVVATVSGLVSIVAAGIGGSRWDLTGVATAWLIVQTLTGIGCLWRLRGLLHSGVAASFPRGQSRV